MMNIAFKRFMPLLCLIVSTVPAWAGLSSDFEAGREAYSKRNIARIAESAEKLNNDRFANYGQYWLLSAQIDQVDEMTMQGYLKTYADSYLADKLRGEWLKSLGKRGDLKTFMRYYPGLVNTDQELSCYRLQAQEQADPSDSVYLREAKALWFNGKDLPASCNTVFNGLFKAQLISQEDLWRRVRLALEAKNFNFAKYLNQLFPAGTGFTPSVLDRVVANPAAYLRQHPDSRSGRAGQELSAFAVAQIAKTDPQSAASELNALLTTLPDSIEQYAWGRVASAAIKRQQAEASSWYALANPQLMSEDDLEWMVRAALRAQNWKQVEQAINAMNAENRAEGAWRYWLARAYRAQNKNPTEANKLFIGLSNEFNFYGLLAREELGSVFEQPAGETYKASNADVRAIFALPSIQRAIALYQIDARTEALREWNWAVRTFDDKQLMAAAELAFSYQWYDRAIYAADRTRNQHDFSLRYLAPFRDITRNYAAQVGLDEAWVYGLMRQESRFVTAASSGVGARGLMQLMPDTARWVAKKMGITYTPTMMNEVGSNIQLGTYYLRDIQRGLNDSPVLATAAYNAGPGRARAWKGNTPLEGAIYAESIPFDETRDYVKKVMANATFYAMVFKHKQPRLTLKQRIGIIPAR